MKRTALLLSLVILLAPAFGRAEGGEGISIDWNGELESNTLLGLSDHPQYLNYHNTNIFTLKAKSVLASKLTAFGEIRFRQIGFTRVANLTDLGERSQVDPSELEITEAYIEHDNFLIDKLDVKIGKQRIAWGAADQINPTDNLNPLNLEDPTDFKQRLAVNALKFTYYAGPVTVTGVYIPYFAPSLIPVSLSEPLFVNALQEGLPAGAAVQSVSDSVSLPAATPENSEEAVKVAWTLFDYDMSVSYFNGRDNLPVATRAVLAPAGLGVFNAALDLCYVHEQVFGFDFSGAIGPVGVWGEAAAFMPDKTETIATLGPLALGTATVYDGSPYYKYTVGADYTFPGGWYANLQFAHGFLIERANTLRNYLTCQIDKNLLDEVLKITLKGGLDVTDIQDGQVGYMPDLEITYKPLDSAEITVGALIIDGQPGTTLGEFKDLDEAYLKLKYMF